MDWTKGWEAKHYASIVDPTTWRDIDRFEITGGRISRANDELRESADIETTNYPQGERWVRIWMDLRQNGASDHIAMFTGLATSPADDIDGNLISNTVECYSVLKPCQDVLLPRGWYAPRGSGEAIIKDLLSVTPAPVEIEQNIPTLNQHIIAEEGETHLSMLNKVLLAMDWRIRITGDGIIHIKPQPMEVNAEFSQSADAIEPQFSKEHDWYGCPNVFRATSGDNTAVVVDESDSLISVLSRGREVWAEDTNASLKNGETLYEYATRRLKEEQMVAMRVNYNRRYNPNVLVGDLIRLNYQQVKGTYFVLSQNIELGHDSTTSEEVVR